MFIFLRIRDNVWFLLKKNPFCAVDYGVPQVAL